MRTISFMLLAAVLITLSACGAATADPSAASAATPEPPAPTQTATPLPTETPPPTASPTPTITPSPAPPEPVQISVVAVGDVMLGRKVNLKMLEYEDFTWPFHEVAPILQEADIALGNLESMFFARCQPTAGRMVFCADPQAVEGLIYAGFDGLSLANNHRRDYGDDGFEQTVDILNEAGITPFYDDVVMITEVDGVRIGVMGFDDKLAWLQFDALTAAIQEAAAQVDVLLGVIHWGQEYWGVADLRQELLGPIMVDAGMDVVIGSHPHRIQPYLEYNGGLIFYSLGNFVFDQTQSEDVRLGHILRLELTVLDGELLSIDDELIPVRIHDLGQPRLIEDDSQP